MYADKQEDGNLRFCLPHPDGDLAAVHPGHGVVEHHRLDRFG